MNREEKERLDEIEQLLDLIEAEQDPEKHLVMVEHLLDICAGERRKRMERSRQQDNREGLSA